MLRGKQNITHIRTYPVMVPNLLKEIIRDSNEKKTNEHFNLIKHVFVLNFKGGKTLA